MRFLLILSALLILTLASCNDKPDSSSAKKDSATGVTGHEPADVNADSMDQALGSDTDEPIVANPCMALPSGSGIPMRGTLTAGPDGLLFTPCLATEGISMADAEDGLLAGLLEEFGYDEGAIYIQMAAGSDGSSFTLEQLWRAAAIGDSFGCREDLGGLLFLANGNEPFWGVEIREDGNIALLRPSEDSSGISETLYTFTEASVDDELTIYNGVNPDTGELISVRLQRETCRDTMSGHYFGMSAEVSHPGGTYRGCAWPGEATEVRTEQ